MSYALKVVWNNGEEEEDVVGLYYPIPLEQVKMGTEKVTEQRPVQVERDVKKWRVKP